MRRTGNPKARAKSDSARSNSSGSYNSDGIKISPRTCTKKRKGIDVDIEKQAQKIPYFANNAIPLRNFT